MTYQGVLAKYGHLLDLPDHTRPVTLLEGDTPLIPAPLLHTLAERGPRTTRAPAASSMRSVWSRVGERSTTVVGPDSA